MFEELFEKQISVKKLYEVLVKTTVFTTSNIMKTKKKEVKKMNPMASAGMFLANFLNVLLTELDMYEEETVITLSDDILAQAIENINEKFR